VLTGVWVLSSLMLSACRVGPFVADALVAPTPDAVADVPRDLPAVPCDLLLQNCANREACYPVDDGPGQTTCQFAGSAPPSTACVSSLECDAREACVLIAESQTMLCATLCDLTAARPCLPVAPCRPMPGYHAGFCVP
jgi:hypothetical protein